MKYLLTLLILLISYLSFSQKWDNTYGTSNYKEACADVLECYDKGYLISGWYQQLDGNWIIKTDINGNLLWDKVIIHNIYEVSDGEINQNNSGDIAIGGYFNFPGGDQWPVVIKLDSCGNKLWCRAYIDDNFSHGWLNDVIILNNGDIIALAKLFSLENYNERIFLYYIDANGNLIWRESYASKEDHPLVLERTGYKIHKFDNEYIINGWCAYPYPGNPGTGYSRPFFIGIDSNFTEKWILPFGIADSIIGEANGVISLNDSVYMGIGYKWQSSNPNSILMFFTSEGEELGYNQIYNDAIGPSVTNNYISDLERLNDTLFVTTTQFGPWYGNTANGEFIIDTAANIYQIEQHPNTSGSSTIIKTFDDKYVIGCNYKHPNNNKDIYLYKINDSLQHDTVYTGNYTYDSLCPYQIESGIIDITDCLLVTDVGEVPTPGEYFASLNTVLIKAYPNPIKEGSITFEFSNTEFLSPPSVSPQGGKPPHLCIYNVFGELVFEERVYQFQGESKVNVGDWYAGMYIAIVFSKNKVVGKTKFVVQ